MLLKILALAAVGFFALRLFRKPAQLSSPSEQNDDFADDGFVEYEEITDE